MEYTINKLAKLAGISTRTLRYYDEIGLLKPARINSSNYRIYSATQVDRLQQIMFYRELGVELDGIKAILESASYEPLDVLRAHHEKLLEKKKELELLIGNVEKTIAMKEGRYQMTDQEKFEGLKKQRIDENEQKYGKEIREKYGEETIKQSNEKLSKMSKEEYDKVEELSLQLNEAIKLAFESRDPAGELAQKACKLHKEWICQYWTQYSKEAHMGLVQMYVDDERFTAYYDEIAPGCAVFLRDAMRVYLGITE